MGGNDSWIAYARAAYRKRYGAEKKINGQVCFGKVVIYTVITGNYDSLSTPSFRSEGVDYLCFTNNRELQSDFWEIRHIEDGILNDVGLSRKPKILAHLYVGEYDTSIYVDAKYHIRGDLLEYARTYWGQSDMLSFPHFRRDSVYEEAAACIEEKKGSPYLLKRQLEAYQKDDFPDDVGLFENGCIVRRHNSPQLIQLMEAWWDQLNIFSARDQLSLPYVCWKQHFLPDICDLYVEDNKYLGFNRQGHIWANMSFNWLYPLHAVLYERRPMNILEFHIGNDTRMIARYAEQADASYSILERILPVETIRGVLHSLDVTAPKTKVCMSPILSAQTTAVNGVVFRDFFKLTEGKRYNLVSMKCLTHATNENYNLIHLDLLPHLPHILADDFAILMDHVEDSEGKRVLQDMENILQAHGIVYEKRVFPERKRKVCLLQSVHHGGADDISIVSLERWQDDIRAFQAERIYLLGLNQYTLSLALEAKWTTGRQIAILRTDGSKEHRSFQGIPCLSADSIDRGGLLFVPNFYQGARGAALDWKQRFGRQGDALILDMRTVQAHLDAMDDESYIRCQWYCTMGYEIDLANPKTFNEKLQWLKLYNRKPEYTTMVDKYAVKQYVANRIGEEYIIPTLGIWNHFDEIDFDALPQQFVLKCTHDSGSVVVVRDKESFDKSAARTKLGNCLHRNFYYPYREWVYRDVKPRIIAEEYIMDESETELKDYKFLCFKGIVKCSFVCSNRFRKGGLKVTFYDRDWNIMPFERHYPRETIPIAKPLHYEQMVSLAENLSQHIPFLRVDFYETAERIYFGELTFFPGAGLEEFTPFEWDVRLGEWIELPT